MLVDAAYLRALLSRYLSGGAGRVVLHLLAEMERAAAERSVDRAAMEPGQVRRDR